jgi:N-acetylmuramoyl-L-alanine amidase
MTDMSRWKLWVNQAAANLCRIILGKLSLMRFGIWDRLKAYESGKKPPILLAIFCIIFIVLCTTFAKADAVTTGARVGGDETRTRFVADISKTVSYSVYVLPDPYRVIIDMPDMNFDLPPGIGRKVRGLVSEYRYGILEPGKSRIVIDTKGPVLIEKSFLVEAQAGQPARIVVDLVKTTETAFASSYSADQNQNKTEIAAVSAEAPIPPPATDSVPEDEPVVEAASSPQETPVVPAAPKKLGRKTIVLDPGHGGIDPGAVSRSGTKEKDVVLAFANSLRNALARTGKYDVVLTRDDDTFIGLKQRVEVARQENADLFIAIHADTVRGQDARGLTIYTLSDKASDAEAEELAKKENRSDIIGGLDLQAENKEVTDILIDLAQRESKNHAVFFSKKAVSQLKPLTLMTGKPMRSAGFMVLKAPDIPSVLIELGYLSSKSDEKLLTSDAWQSKIAKAFVNAIDGYFTTELASKSN